MKRVNTSLDWDISILEKHCPASLIGVDEVGRGAWAGPLVACGGQMQPI